MKALAGAEPDKTPDYATQTLNELDKVQSKAILLNDMLNNAREGERIGLEGDVYEQVAAACRGARPKIQKWIEQDDGERAEMMDRLLLCNDLINNALERYQAVKAGDWSKAQALVESYVTHNHVPECRANTSANPNKKAADLISFDAFADDEAPLSGDGSLALPSGSTQASSSASGSASAGFSSSGLPLDLFSAPSPASSPAFSNTTTSTGAPRQDPMAFFNTAPSSSSQVPAYQQSFAGLGSFAQAPQPQQQQYGGANFIQPQPQQPSQQWGFQSPQASSPAPAGYSLSPQPAQPAQQSLLGSNGTSTPQQPISPAPAPAQNQAKKNDAFADLVDLMG